MTAYELRISDWRSDGCSSERRGRQHNRPTLGKPGQNDPRSGNTAIALARDQCVEPRYRRAHALLIGTLVDRHAANIVPGAHAHAAVDRYLALRRMGKHETQWWPVRAQQLRHDRSKIVAISAQSVQPQQIGRESCRESVCRYV